MISSKLKSPHEIALSIAKQAQNRRLQLNLSQQTLSQQSGVCYGTLKKFEQTGQISLESLLKIALVLDALDVFQQLFAESPDTLPATLDELLANTSRKRGRQ